MQTDTSAFSPQPSSFLCSRCQDNGVWLTPRGIVSECPNLQLKLDDHKPLTEAANMILRAGRSLAFRKLIANPIAFGVAVELARHSTSEPCPRQRIIDLHFSWTRSQALREYHYIVEELRSVWLLPVGSRKGKPHGYWICIDEKDFREWVDRSRSAPVKQLTTIHAVAKANWPVFGEQLELEFWKDFNPSAISAT